MVMEEQESERNRVKHECYICGKRVAMDGQECRLCWRERQITYIENPLVDFKESVSMRLMRNMICVLFVLLTGMVFGAMTRDQVCIEQNGWHQASLAVNSGQRGFNVWTPYGDVSDEWLCWQVAQDATYIGYPQFGLFKCKIKAGWYMACNKAITNGSAGPIWYPAVDGGGAGVDLTQGASGWSVLENASMNYFSALYPPSSTRYIDLKVPAGTTRLYLVGSASGTQNHLLVVTNQTTAGNVVDASITFNLTGDLTAYGEQMYYPNSDPAGADYTGYPHYQSVCLVATNCGGETLRFTGTVDTSIPLVVGFIAINDSSTAQPDTGVMDPTTIEYIMPSSYDNAGAQTAYGQYVEGPLTLNIHGGTLFVWGGIGAQHFTATNKWTSPTVTVYADRTLWADYNKTAGTTWTPTAEIDEWKRTTADCITMTGTGTVSINDGATTIADIGTYRLTHQYTSSGMAIFQYWKFNTNVDAEGAEVNFDKDNYGGSIAQWSLSNKFTRYLRVPLDTSYQLVGTINNNVVFSSNITKMYCLDHSRGMVAIFDGGFYFYDTSLTTSAINPFMQIYANSTGDDYLKLYLFPFEAAVADIAIAENDEILSYQKRQVVPASMVGDIYKGTGGEIGGSSGARFNGMY